MSPPTSRPTPFLRNQVPAEASAVGRVRDDFAVWLRRTCALDETRLCDVVLAVNEALANAAEFAYPNRPGTIDVAAECDAYRPVLTVTVTDRGHWRHTDPLLNQRNRGRGIPLMRSLADAVVIDTSGRGTSVCLRFDNVYVGGRLEVAVL